MNNKLILVFMMCIFLVGTVSAFEFDNRLKSYDPITQTIIIEDRNLIFPERDLVKIQLKDNTYNCGVECSAIWNVTIYADDDDFLSDLVFEKVKGIGGVSEHRFEYISGYRDVVYDDYGKDCKVLDELGLCTKIKIGEHIEKVPIWSTFNPETKLSPGNYIVKLIGKKQWGDSVDWIPTFYGIEIRQWAFWATSDPSAYWNFNEVSAETQAEDFLGLSNMTRLSTTGVGFIPSKLNNGINMNNTASPIAMLNTTDSSEFNFGTSVFTIVYWINGSSEEGHTMAETDVTISTGWGWGRQSGGVHQFSSDNAAVIDTVISVSNSNWSRVVWVREGTGSDQFRVYVNTRNTNNGTLGGDLNDPTHNFTINSPNTGGITNLDDLQIYNGFAWNLADVIFDYNGGVGLEANISGDIVVTLNTPINGSQIFPSLLSFNATADPMEFTLTNATIRLYNSSTTLFQESTNILGNLSNETIFNVTSIRVGDYIWNVEFCGTNGTGNLCSSANSNFTFSRIVIINQSVNFTDPVIEGSTESFSLNLTFNSTTFTLGSATFVYDNNGSSSIITGTGDNRLITSSIIIPSVSADTNKSFFWNISFTDTLIGGTFIQSTNVTNQSVLNIGVDTCGVFTNRILNFTVVDEELQTFITSATIEIAVNLFDQSRTIQVANVSGNFTNPTTICISLDLTNTTIYSLDTIVRYELPLQFANEFYNIVNSSLTINSTTQNIILFDLNISDSTEFQLTFIGSDFLPVENALVFVDRQYIAENVFKTVELPKTDSNGQTILHLVRNDVIYNIRISKDGIVLGNFENIIAFCEDFVIGDCKINLNAVGSTPALFNYDEVLGITFTSPTFNNNTRVIEFDFLTFDGSSKTVLMNVTRSDIFGNRTICEDTLTSSGGTLSCTVSSNIDDADLQIRVFVDGEQAVFRVIKLDLSDFGVAGYLVLFVMSLGLIMMFSSSRTGILIAVLLSFTGAVGLGIITSSITGSGAKGINASGIWLIIIVLIGIWKLNKDRIQ